MPKSMTFVALLLAALLPPPLDAQVQETDAEFVTPDPIGAWVPPRVNGDANFKGREPDGWPVVEVAAQLSVSEDRCRLLAHLYMDALEPKPDSTRVAGWSDAFVIYETGENDRIDMIWPDGAQLGDDASLVVRGHEEIEVATADCPKGAECTANGLVTEWRIVGDTTEGDDAGYHTKVAASLGRIGLVIRPAYREDPDCSRPN